MFGLTRGEIAMSAFIFALIYGAGLLPRLAKWLTRTSETREKTTGD